MALGVPEFRRALILLGDLLDGDVGKLIGAVGRLDVPAALRLVTDAYPELSSPYLAAAADLTATWYEDQPAAIGAKPFIAAPAELPAIEQLAANARWALTQKKPTTALQGAGRRAIFQSHRDTVLLNVEREGVSWAREARPGACGFCRMTTTRILTEGFGGAPGLYRSEGTADANPHTEDAKGHDHCRCVAVPIRGGHPYTVPGYVHDWLDDYEQVSRDEDGRLLNAWTIADRMEKRAAERGEPVDEATASFDRETGRAEPAIVDLDAGTRPPVPAVPAGPRPPLALPAGQSAGRLAIEAPAAQKALNRPPIALGTGREPKQLTAGPVRLAIEAAKVVAPDVGAIAAWLDAEDDHRAALDYWRRVDVEDLHNLPADEKLEVSAPADRPPADPVDLIPPDPDPVVDVQADDRRGESPMDRAVREFEEAVESGDDEAIERAADAMEALEAVEEKARARAEKAAQAKAEKLAKQVARREAARDADQQRIYELIEAGEDPQIAEAEVLSTNADGLARRAKLIRDRAGLYDETSAEQAVYGQILERIRRRDFMAQARADGHTGKGFDDLLDGVFQLRVDHLYLEAENATNGYMVKRPYVTKFNPRKLWYVNDATARKYMSEEMANWFDENGRLTRPVMRQMILDGSSNYSAYTHMVGDFNQ